MRRPPPAPGRRRPPGPGPARPSRTRGRPPATRRPIPVPRIAAAHPRADPPRQRPPRPGGRPGRRPRTPEQAGPGENPRLARVAGPPEDPGGRRSGTDGSDASSGLSSSTLGLPGWADTVGVRGGHAGRDAGWPLTEAARPGADDPGAWRRRWHGTAGRAPRRRPWPARTASGRRPSRSRLARAAWKMSCMAMPGGAGVLAAQAEAALERTSPPRAGLGRPPEARYHFSMFSLPRGDTPPADGSHRGAVGQALAAAYAFGGCPPERGESRCVQFQIRRKI